MENFVAEPIFFEGEEKEEQVLILLRSHLIINLGWILNSLFLLGIPVIAWIVLGATGAGSVVSLPSAFLIVAVWVLLTAGVAFQQFLHWYFNLYILTNKRLVDIDFIGLFHRRVSQTPLSNIQDVTYSKSGILQNFFDFGDMHIQTAGESSNFEFQAIPDPEGSQRKILELITKIKDGRL